MKLVLGVADVAYSDASTGGATTTGEVAQILEDRYHVMETFYDSRKDKIAEWLSEGVAKAIEDLVDFGIKGDPTFRVMQKIEAEFRAFLTANEMTHLFGQLTPAEAQYFIDKTGGFTKAGAAGINHRLKHPYASKNEARPAFIDTGLYQASFRAWVEQ